MNKSIVGGSYHSVALRDTGTIECWGSNEENQCDPVYKTFECVINIACGDNHSVALLEDRTIECWDLMNIINVSQFIKHLSV